MKPLRKSIVALLFLLFGSLSVVAAQAQASAATCPDIVRDALQAASGACAGIGRNQACYGNFTLQTQFRSDVTPPKFDAIGDLADVAGIKTLQLSSFDASEKSWGVALMKIQANLPDALPGQNVTFVMFGNVEIDDASNPPVTLSLTASRSANVRSSPSTQSKVVTTLKSGAAVVGNGRLADSSWLRIALPDDSGEGWVLASLLRGDGDLKTLAVVDPSAPALTFGPMQAFYFKSGLGNTPCSAVPPNGILLQSPANQRVTLMVNGAQLTLGSTVFVQAQPGGFMTISVIEGNVTVTVNGATVAVPAGASARVPLDVNGLASGSPDAPQPYDSSALAALPTVLLPIPVTVAPLAVTPLATAAVTAEATTPVASDVVPKSGSWSDETIKMTGCYGNIPATVTLHIQVQSDGSSFAVGGAIYDRTAPGVYTRRGLPIDLGADSSTVQTFNVYVLSATQMRAEQTSTVPSMNCGTSSTSLWTYVGP